MLVFSVLIFLFKSFRLLFSNDFCVQQFWRCSSITFICQFVVKIDLLVTMKCFLYYFHNSHKILGSVSKFRVFIDQLHSVNVFVPETSVGTAARWKPNRVWDYVPEMLQDGHTINHNLVEGDKRRVCQFCKHSGQRFRCGETRKSFYKCSVCNVFLCKKECFRKYHEMTISEIPAI